MGQQVLGEEEASRRYDIFQRTKETKNFFKNADVWEKNVLTYGRYGYLYECGIIARTPETTVILAFSMPWESLEQHEQSWIKQLSADPLRNFVGREDILSDFRELLTEVQQEHGEATPVITYRTNGTFWEEATKLNSRFENPELYRYRVKKFTFADRIAARLEEKRVSINKISQATTITGYTTSLFHTPLGDSLSFEVNPIVETNF